MRLVAVAVDDHDVAGRQQRLHRHLVRRRGAVGDEEDVIGAEGARRLVLRLLDVAGRLQQAVETAGGGAAFGQEQVGPVELAHVADPVGLEDRLAARDRQRMEGADRPLRVFLQVVEERRVVAILHAFEDREVQFQQFLHRIEDAAHRIRLGIAGDLFDPAVRHEVKIELGPYALEDLRQVQRRCFRRLVLVDRFGQRAQHRRVVPRAERKAFVDDDGGKVGIEHRRAERVLEAADEDRLVDERVHRPAQPAPFRGERGPARGRRAGDDQDFEIGPVRVRAAQRGRQDIGRRAVTVLVDIPIAGVLTEGAREQHAGDAARERRGRMRIVRRGMVAQRVDQMGAGIGVKLLGRGNVRECRLEFGAIAGAAGPSLGQFNEMPPLIAARAGTREELIDPSRVMAGCLGHARSSLHCALYVASGTASTLGAACSCGRSITDDLRPVHVR